MNTAFSPLPQSFRTRLAVLFGGLTILIGGPLYFYIEQTLAAQLTIERGKAIQALAKSVAAVMANDLQERQREIDLVAQSPLYRRSALDSQEMLRSLTYLQQSYPRYSWLGVADAEGKVKAATGGLLLGVSVKQRPWFVAGSKGSFTGDLHEAVLLAKLLPATPGVGPPRFIDFAAPIFDDAGRLRGVLGAHADWGWAADVVSVVAPRDPLHQFETFIVSASGEIMYPESRGEVLRVPATLSVDQPFTIGHWDDSTRYFSSMVAMPAPVSAAHLGWRIVVRQPESVAMASLHAVQKRLLLFGGGVAIVFIVLIYVTASLLSRNLENLAGFARRVEEGGDPAGFSLQSSTSEVRHLFEALRSMAAKLLDSKHELERKVVERTAELASANEELNRLARRDALTGLHNRLAANEALQTEFRRMQRTQVPYSVLLMDIDFFKKVNDTYGHEVGDLVLQHVAGVIASQVRVTDLAARFGGEEFLALLPATSLAEATVVAEKVRTAVAASPAPEAGTVTLSIGVAMVALGHTDESDAVRAADANLYRAKEQGRNRVVA